MNCEEFRAAALAGEGLACAAVAVSLHGLTATVFDLKDRQGVVSHGKQIREYVSYYVAHYVPF